MSKLTWETMRDRWPNADASRFVEASGLTWHVQVLGTGPALVLLHGSGAATHSWRDVLPNLARHFTVIAPDLPGHGFTTRPVAERLSLVGMAQSISDLLRVLEVTPNAIVGHSAGGALALWLATQWPESRIVGINAALTPPHALMSLLAPAAHALAPTGFMGALTARLAESDFVFNTLMNSTGSVIAADQRALYRAFASDPEHAGAVMTMFANWDLGALEKRMSLVTNAVTLVVGSKDGWVPPADTHATARRIANARMIEIAGAGHLAHEERPAEVCDIIRSAVA